MIFRTIRQLEITLQPKSRGFHLVTGEIMRQLPKLPKTGVINIFCKHTSSLQAKRNRAAVNYENLFTRLQGFSFFITEEQLKTLPLKFRSGSAERLLEIMCSLRSAVYPIFP